MEETLKPGKWKKKSLELFLREKLKILFFLIEKTCKTLGFFCLFFLLLTLCCIGLPPNFFVHFWYNKDQNFGPIKVKIINFKSVRYLKFRRTHRSTYKKINFYFQNLKSSISRLNALLSLLRSLLRNEIKYQLRIFSLFLSLLAQNRRIKDWQFCYLST